MLKDIRQHGIQLVILFTVIFYALSYTQKYIRNSVIITDIRTYIIKNSTNLPEDVQITQDPDDQEDFPQPSVYWLPSQEIYFTSAFLDTRYNDSIVRIIGVQYRNQITVPECIFDAPNGQVTNITTEVHLIYPHWPGKSLYFAAIYSCKPPKSINRKRSSFSTYNYNSIITSIRICSNPTLPCVTIPLSRPYLLSSTGAATPRRDVALCSKSYKGELEWRRLVEWFETNRLVGVSTVVVYDDGIRGRAQQVLEYYKGVRFVRKLPFPLMSVLHDHATKEYVLSKEEYFSISQQVYLASLNDCILRYGARYEFFLIIDYDETLLPMREESVFFMAMRQANRHPLIAGFTFETAWHFEDFAPTVDEKTNSLYPTNSNQDITAAMNTNTSTHTHNNKYNNITSPSLYTLTHNRRTDIINNQPKSLIRAEAVLSVNWHAVIKTHEASQFGLNKMIKPANDSAYVHHYRGVCIDKFLKATCTDMLKSDYVDGVVVRYADRLHERVRKVFNELEVD